MQFEQALEGKSPDVLVANLLDRWELTGEEREALAVLQKESPKDLLEIHYWLLTQFPCDPDLRYSWIRLANQAFDGKTPLSVIIEGHVDQVLHYLRNSSSR